MSTCISSQKRSSSGIIAPVGHMLGNKLLSFAKSRLPVANLKPKTRASLNVPPIPFAPLVDTHVFQPPPPYCACRDDPAEFLPVPHNTPDVSAASVVENSVILSGYAHAIGLGLEGVEKGDGGRFDGLGRLSGGFRAEGTNDTVREQVRRMHIDHSRRRRTRANEQPTMRHDVFYASVEVRACERVINGVPVKIRIRRKSAASPTPGPRGWERATISSELKRAASAERRAGQRTVWRM